MPLHALRRLFLRLSTGLLFVLPATLLGGCGGGTDVGAACDTRGSVDECVEGAVCDQDPEGSVICLEICESQDDCSEGYTCNGVSGSSLKACRLDK